MEASPCLRLRAQRVRPASAGLPLLRPGTGSAPARNRTRHIRFPRRPGPVEGESRGRRTREHGAGGTPEPPSPPQGGMSAAKPKRIKFSDEEKFLILEEFSLRKDILIPKSGRYRNTQDRQRAWEEIAAAVNALSPVVRRTAEEIRKKWHNMVLDARRELAADKHPLLRQRPQERLFHHIFALFNKPGPPPAPSFGLPAAAPEPLPRGPAPESFPGPEERPLPGAESRLQPAPGPAAPRAAQPQGAAPGPPPGNPEPPRVKCPPSPALAWPCLEAMASPASLGTGSPGPPHDNGEQPPIRAGTPDPISNTGVRFCIHFGQRCCSSLVISPFCPHQNPIPTPLLALTPSLIPCRWHSGLRGAVRKAEAAAHRDPGAAEGDPATAEGEDRAGKGEAPPGNPEAAQGVGHVRGCGMMPGALCCCSWGY